MNRGTLVAEVTLKEVRRFFIDISSITRPLPVNTVTCMPRKDGFTWPFPERQIEEELLFISCHF